MTVTTDPVGQDKGWRQVPLRYVAKCLDGQRIPLNSEERSFRSGPYPYWGANGIVDYIDDYIFDEQLVLLGEDGAPFFDPLKPVAFAVEGKIWVNNHIHVLRVRDDYDFRYVAACLNVADYSLWIEGSTRDKLTQDNMLRIGIHSPPKERQTQIAQFLDKETADIDALIAAKQKLLDLMAEKRRAIVAEAVMRGLDPSAPLRPSGIDWLGEIPAHWEVERSRWLFSERDQRSQTGEEEMLTVSHLTGVTPRSEKDVNMFEAESTAGYKLCFAGDLAINTLWAWMGAMGTARVDGIVSPAYNVYTPGPRLLPDYVDALVRIPVFAQEVTRYSKGVWSSRLRLYPEGFFETWWPVPPLDEQQQIVEHISTETAKIDRLRTATENSIALLKERRAALIAAAVTGQLEIPEAA
ncbi:restriction endonuclease subunit S [Rhodobacter sp. HX-7-19]|uniref:Restriction endonuclease subunit S n=1 Tax=Paragemmobacter kunshanensis TaxID=2583234 RepID=A0A6M1U1D6_9RHOB|nr:restriction endonuclease subunit S [Rhodobacter kunshanensis]NGQ92522.1 restriction endonuclease subunit S [Rhodobacter kunshanensis]